MSRTLFSTSVKSPKSLARASAASTEFWAACSKRTKNSLFLGRSDRRTGVLLCRHMLRHRDRVRKPRANPRARGNRQRRGGVGGAGGGRGLGAAFALLSASPVARVRRAANHRPGGPPTDR